ncbi:MAG TPA: glycosyltransferase [Candidatus Acidoferrum sp.]|nr:glycosyltransferase [Candidatus Acidoferrum sp.]
MKLLNVIRSLNPARGGPVESLKQCASAMAEMGHTTEAVALDPPDAPWVRDLSFPVHALGPGSFAYGYSPTLIPWLQKRAGDYDAVVVRGIWQYHSFACWRALRRSSTPYVVFPHGMLDPWFKRTYPLKHAKKWMYWPWAEYRVLRDAKAVLFTCEEERLLARDSFRLYDCKEIVVNYGTVAPEENTETQKTAFFARYPELRSKRLALFMGRIHSKKGCDLLIEAFADVLGYDPDWHLVLAGPDQVGWQADLVALARRRLVSESITWTGMISGDVKYGALKAAEVFVLPSHQENFGIVVAEALACGIPVLISNKVNIWREIQQDGAGMVESDDLEGTRYLFRNWLALSALDRQRMKDRARECFRNRFEIGKSAESIVKAIASFVHHGSETSVRQDGPDSPKNLGPMHNDAGSRTAAV